jgi:hypothetical protein
MNPEIILNNMPKVIVTLSDFPKRTIFLEDPNPYVTSFKGKSKK